MKSHPKKSRQLSASKLSCSGFSNLNSALTVSISNRQRVRKLDLRWLKKIAAATLAELKIERAELGIVLVGAKEMTSLNEEFLGHEGATDVITFDYGSPESEVQGPQSTVCSPEAKRLRTADSGLRTQDFGLGTWDSGLRTHLHGEIFICIPEAERQAKIFGTRWQAEVVRYIIHGILHLTGHDDLQSAARKKMKREEERLVRKVSSVY